METIVPRVCGLDVHQASVVACVLIDGGKKRGSCCRARWLMGKRAS